MRPKLTNKLDPKLFKQNYWLKEELVNFCKQNNLPTSGSKEGLEALITRFLNKEPLIFPKKKTFSSKDMNDFGELTVHSVIKPNYKNDERHRNFFKKEIGEYFKFNIRFMDWMRKNAGKTYQAAIEEWQRIEKQIKSGKKFPIAKQFKYNQYTRDFFADNPQLTKKEALLCWNYKKTLPGDHKYERSDLHILKK